MPSVKIEGDPKDIKDLFVLGENQVKSFKKKSSLEIFWIIIPILIFFTLNCLVMCNVINNKSWLNITELAALLFLGIVVIILQQKYSSPIITWLAVLFGISIFLISIREITISQAAKTIQDKLQPSTKEKSEK